MNFLRKKPKHRGLPDRTHHDVDAPTAIPISSAAPSPPSTLPPSSSEPLYPVAYPNTTYYGHINHPHTSQPFTAYPYQSQQDDHGESGREEWEVNTGNSVNKKGTQKSGNVKANNGSFAAGSAAQPRNGRTVLNTGGMTNDGDVQESGNIEYVNGNVGLHGNPTANKPS